MRNNFNKGFTLIELLAIVAILATIITATVVVMNPIEMLRQAEDTVRLNDFNSIHQTLNLFQSNRPGDSIGVPNIVYVSIPSDSPTCVGLGLPALPSGWAYRCVTTANLRNINGTGWIPVNFTTITGRIPLTTLPIDPINTATSGNYYAYVTNGTSWALATIMGSRRHAPSALRDGGPDLARYEVGTNLTIAPFTHGLVGYWSFDGTGSIANNQTTGLRDESGRGNHGTASNVNGTGMAFVPGRVGNAVTFDGVDDVVDYGNIGAISNFTIELWFNSTAVENHRNLFHTHFPITGFDTTGVRVEQYTGGLFRVGVSANNIWRAYSITSTLIANRWYHLVVTRNGNTLLVYLDSVLRVNISNTSWPSDFPRMNIGRGSSISPDRWFRGNIDEVRIYNRALTEAEIRTIFNATR